MQKRLGAFLIALLFVSSFVLLPFVQSVDAALTPEQDAAYRAELANVEKEIASLGNTIKDKQAEGSSLERDKALLTAEIAQAKLKVRAKTILLQQLGKDIGAKNTTIKTLSQKIERNQESIADILRKTRELDEYTLTELVLARKNFSDFFTDLDAYDTIQEALTNSYNIVKEAKADTESEKTVLEQKSRRETDAKKEIEAEQHKIEVKEKEKAKLLALNKEQQSAYQSVLNAKKARAAQIRAALFGLRDSAAIPFGVALEYAKAASAKTGVRPAFLLAILTQETNLGKNVGTCNRPQDPPNKHWRVIMKPDRDQTPYLAITKELGIDPENQPLSCPLPSGGWGGAMGPAQFIPSTWVLYKDRVSAATGNSPANPWNPQDAFFASAIFLADLGASRGGYSAEREAALKYYAGGGWNKPANAFYGNGVMAKVKDIQENQIDPLE